MQTIREWPWSKLQPVLERAAQRADARTLLLGALLHADIALLTPLDERRDYPHMGRVLLAFDGQREGASNRDPHVGSARKLLDRISPNHPRWAETRSLVAGWYRSVAASLAKRFWLADLEPHLSRARERFPDDAGVLFDSGCLAETFASPDIQAALHPSDPTIRLSSTVVLLQERQHQPRALLADAETYFRRALAQDPKLLEARVRLARVLLLKGRNGAAVSELASTEAAPQAGVVRYYRELFMGLVMTRTGDYASARAAYGRAAAAFPDAPSPRFGMAFAASRQADSPGTIRSVQAALQQSASIEESADPWWAYYQCAGRDADRAYETLARQIERFK